jgi:hypothetical protein
LRWGRDRRPLRGPQVSFAQGAIGQAARRRKGVQPVPSPRRSVPCCCAGAHIRVAPCVNSGSDLERRCRSGLSFSLIHGRTRPSIEQHGIAFAQVTDGAHRRRTPAYRLGKRVGGNPRGLESRFLRSSHQGSHRSRCGRWTLTPCLRDHHRVAAATC